MDPISFTASTISIATLAVQLGDALRKAAEFWKSVQDAPADIRRLYRELRLVANVFDAIRAEYEAGSVPTSFEIALKNALELAKDDIGQFSEVVSDLLRQPSTSGGSVAKQWRKDQNWHSRPFCRHPTLVLLGYVRNIVINCCWSTEVRNFIFRIWSKMALSCGIDLHGVRKQMMGTNALKGDVFYCCRVVHLEILYGDQRDDLLLKVDDTTAPEFSHLDPLYLCKLGRPCVDITGPGRCLSAIPETLIEDGRFRMNMPGQWEEPLVSNSELVLQMGIFFRSHSIIFHGQELEGYIRPKVITEADIQRVEENLRRATL